MLSNKKIVCPNNLINVAKKVGVIDAAIVNAGEIFPMESVYKAVEHNLIRKLVIGDGKAKYEKKIGKPHHDHMICIETGDIIEFVSDEIENIQDEIAKKHGYKIIKHIHQLFVKPIKK